MKCPFCDAIETKVIDKRVSEDLQTNRRRRECLICSRRFTTYERVETGNILVIKKDGTRERFNREKILKGIIKSCEKRPIDLEKIEMIVNEIERDILSKDGAEINSTEIGELIMDKLKNLDDVAYIRFASVYRRFKDITSFEKELKKLK
ncbi:MAG: transcriptional repressor NrdR [Candidatus Aenigmarchaeota archaeon]|nr:transcriptional repressor NrdR [Candidatus Aenigmarchaeota archaeon]